MNWKELRAIKSKKINIESHTCNHYYISSLNNDNDIVHEFKYSKIKIEQELNNQCNFIAYPIGSYNHKIKSIAKKYYKAGFAVNNKLVDLARLDLKDDKYLYEIPRINMYGDYYIEMLFRAIGFHQRIKNLLFWK